MKETTSAVIRRPQRTLTPADHEIVWSTALLNLHGGLIMGIIDPVPNLSPMSEDEGAWVRAQVWPRFLTEIDDKYPFGFWRWSSASEARAGTASVGDAICVSTAQEGGPHVDGNVEWVHNARGRCVAKLLIRSDDAPCVWWCRCPCPKDGPLASEPETPPTSADTAGRPDGGAERGSRRVEGACEPAGHSVLTTDVERPGGAHVRGNPAGPCGSATEGPQQTHCRTSYIVFTTSWPRARSQLVADHW